jgi:hypothetical protein
LSNIAVTAWLDAGQPPAPARTLNLLRGKKVLRRPEAPEMPGSIADLVPRAFVAAAR